jgi:hypothetical protein
MISSTFDEKYRCTAALGVPPRYFLAKSMEVIIIRSLNRSAKGDPFNGQTGIISPWIQHHTS